MHRDRDGSGGVLRPPSWVGAPHHRPQDPPQKTVPYNAHSSSQLVGTRLAYKDSNSVKEQSNGLEHPGIGRGTSGMAAVGSSSSVEFWNRSLTVAVSLCFVLGFAHSSKMMADAYGGLVTVCMHMPSCQKCARQQIFSSRVRIL